MSTYTNQEILTLVVLERLGGCLSLFSVGLIFLFYGLFERLRTVPNTFIVFASIANVGASLASVISYNGLWAGQSSAVCQAQGFLFEMFVQSDPWWSLAMAINVLMVFFMGASPQVFKKWGWLYCVVCYGGPFVIAIVCLELHDPAKGPVYGSAGLWCWISNDWNPLRIYTYYMLIWICILSSGVIYTCVGVHVFRSRNRVRQFMDSNRYGTTTSISASANRPVSRPITKVERGTDWPLPSSAMAHNPMQQGTVEVTTEIRITSTTSGPQSSDVKAPPRTMASIPQRVDADYDSDATDALSPGLKSHSPAPRGEYQLPRPMHRIPAAAAPSWPNPASRAQTSGGAYVRGTGARQGGASSRKVLNRFVVMDPVKRAYLRTSFLFAVSVLVTWIPSSINRIRGLIYSDSPFSYNVATASVLPLQGVWNAVIFFVTSWTVLKECLGDSWSGCCGGRRRRRDVLPPRRVIAVGGSGGMGDSGMGMSSMTDSVERRRYQRDWSGDDDGMYEMKKRREDMAIDLEDGDRRELVRPPTEPAGDNWDFHDIGLARGSEEPSEDSFRLHHHQ